MYGIQLLENYSNISLFFLGVEKKKSILIYNILCGISHYKIRSEPFLDFRLHGTSHCIGQESTCKGSN